MKERIEIFPGHWIEVTKRIKKAAGIPQSARVIATLRGETAEAARNLGRDTRGTVKYPTLLLDEAVRIARRIGITKATKETGIGRASIDLRRRQIKRKRGESKVRAQGSRYTLAQKQACVRLAQDLMANGGTVQKFAKYYNHKYVLTRPRWSHRKAFIEAGRRLGMNGRSIEWMWVQGTIPLHAQQSATR